MDALTVLVIILSSALAVFLVLAIFVIIKVLQIVNHLKRITEKAEHIVDSAETVGDFFKSSAQSMSIGRMLAHVYETVRKKTK